MTRVAPMFLADWLDTVFIHFRLDANLLQPSIPFELDTWRGDAMVSLVAFTQANLRPAVGGRIARWLATPLASHSFLNLRTYVRNGNDRGIYFLAEWIPNRVAAFIGPRTYGLPYRLGRLRYKHDLVRGKIHDVVSANGMRFEYRGSIERGEPFQPAVVDSLDHFLVERYHAFTSRAGVYRQFDVAHAPWPIAPVKVDLLESDLIGSFLPLMQQAQLVCAHASPGVNDVSISAPQRVNPQMACPL